ncbi:MAG: hypothetical protein ACP5MD_16065 [Verrucomicrobiia bacterium]
MQRFLAVLVSDPAVWCIAFAGVTISNSAAARVAWELLCCLFI